jgi:hypothetical protein
VNAYCHPNAAFHCNHSIAFISAAISQHLHIIASSIDVSELEVDASGLGAVHHRRTSRGKLSVEITPLLQPCVFNPLVSVLPLRLAPPTRPGLFQRHRWP